MCYWSDCAINRPNYIFWYSSTFNRYIESSSHTCNAPSHSILLGTLSYLKSARGKNTVYVRWLLFNQLNSIDFNWIDVVGWLENALFWLCGLCCCCCCFLLTWVYDNLYGMTVFNSVHFQNIHWKFAIIFHKSFTYRTNLKS